jgi:hypothetical protein
MHLIYSVIYIFFCLDFTIRYNLEVEDSFLPFLLYELIFL